MTICPIRVLVVDNHLVVRRGLATLLLAFIDLLLVGEAQSGAEALELCATVRPDVILMDLLTSELDGADTIRIVRAHYPDTKVIVLSAFEEYALIQRAFAAGASGILLKNMSCDELASNIRRVHAGRATLAPKSIEDIMRISSMPALLPSELGGDLTSREYEVLALMTHGLTNVQIGKELIITRATAKSHVSTILSKLGVTTRTEAVALAVQIHLTKGPG